MHIPAVRRQGPTSLRLGKANPRSMACLLLLLAVLVCRADDDDEGMSASLLVLLSRARR